MPERLERNEKVVENCAQKEVNNPVDVVKVYLYLRLVTVFMSPEQKRRLLEKIVLFEIAEHSFRMNLFISSFAILDDDQVLKIMDCLEDEEHRTELVRMMSVKGFM